MKASMKITIPTNSAARVVLMLLLVLPAAAAEFEWSTDFEQGNLDRWYLPLPEHWEIAATEGGRALHLKEGGPMGANPRRPVKFAVLKDSCVGSFELQVKVRKDPKEGESDLIIVFGFQDKTHFYYAHMSSDSGDHEVHNGIFKVNGADRERIGGEGSRPALPDTEWHTVRIVRNTRRGTIELFMDGEAEPRFEASDKEFFHGRVGLGSFNDTGMFDDFRLTGTTRKSCSDHIETLDGLGASGS